MEERVISQYHLARFAKHLRREEKSEATQEKYLRDVHAFWDFADSRCITKELVMAYKQACVEMGYAVRSINSMLASVNSFLHYMRWSDCKVKNLRIQRQMYCTEDRELTKADYLRLLEASRHDRTLHLILQTICATGIRVSELQHFTVEAVCRGEVTVQCKSKTRIILIPMKLRRLLESYAKKRKILTGPIFLGTKGKPMDRSVIWRRMKRLCHRAGVKESKVFPHNLRKLFARTFYRAEKDIAKLADILGHSSINTTRIYIMTTGTEHRRQIERLGLVV